MRALSTPLLLMRCMAPDKDAPGRLCGCKFGRAPDPVVRVQEGGFPIICPKCGALHRFAEAKEAA